MSLPYPIAFNGSTFRTVNIEKRLPTIETMIKAMPNITIVIFGIALIIVSIVGSLFSILTVRKVDPLKAIG